MVFQTFLQKVEKREFPLTWPGHRIGRQWVTAQKTKESKSSMSPNYGYELVSYPIDREALTKAIEVAFGARKKLASLNLPDRLELLRQFRQVLADYQKPLIEACRIEAGKPLWEAQSDAAGAITYLDNILEHADSMKDSLLAPAQLGNAIGHYYLQPMGVTVAYLPFSTPISSFVCYLGAAIFTGCPLIVVPSSHACLTAILYGFLEEHIEFPAGSLNIVFGNFDVFKQSLADKRVRAIIFTGSREHCEVIRRESRNVMGRELILQSGGKNATIVHSSADLKVATKCVLLGALKSAGQLCTSTSRVFIYETLRKEFLEMLTAAMGSTEIGPTDRSPDPILGPLYSKKAVEKFLRFQTMAQRESVQTHLRGQLHKIPGADGNFVSPGIHEIESFDAASAYQSNVLFCPDIAVYTYTKLDDAIEKINSTDASFGVSFMGDPEVVEQRRELFFAPNIMVNLPTVEMEASLPLAGRLHSGHHRYNGHGISLFLSYPQVIHSDARAHKVISSWPDPKI